MQEVLLNKHINVEVDPEWFSTKKCHMNQNKLYIFGDNLVRVGKAGQAQIRDEFNATGLATKSRPTMEPNAFFTDEAEEFFKNQIAKDLIKIKQRLNNNINFDTIVFPIDGLGTGLSELPTRAPNVYKYLCEMLEYHFNIITLPNGKLQIKG